jgi:hypothetical protein
MQNTKFKSKFSLKDILRVHRELRTERNKVHKPWIEYKPKSGKVKEQLPNLKINHQ